MNNESFQMFYVGINNKKNFKPFSFGIASFFFERKIVEKKSKLTWNDFFVGFIHFADISIDIKGMRRLIFEGFSYGFHRECPRFGYRSWRCMKSTYDKWSGKWIKCNATVKTKMIDGFTMLESNSTKHNHWKFSTCDEKYKIWINRLFLVLKMHKKTKIGSLFWQKSCLEMRKWYSNR